MSSSSSPETSEKSQIDSGELRRWRIRQLDIPTQLLRLLVLVAGFLVWQYELIFKGVPLTIFGFEPLPKINPIFYAVPTDVWGYLADYYHDLRFWQDLWVTLQEAIWGFAIGGSTGFIVGIVLGYFLRLQKIFGPFLVFANAVPKIAFAPILILWYGVDMGSKIALATIIVFFIVQMPTTAAVGLVDPDLNTLATTMGATKSQLFKKVVIPGIMPAVFGALRLAAIYSMLSVVFGEFIASKRGLGQKLLVSTNMFNMASAFALMLVLAIVALALNGVIGLAERRVLKWQTTRRGGQVISL